MSSSESQSQSQSQSQDETESILKTEETEETDSTSDVVPSMAPTESHDTQMALQMLLLNLQNQLTAISERSNKTMDILLDRLETMEKQVAVLAENSGIDLETLDTEILNDTSTTESEDS